MSAQFVAAPVLWVVQVTQTSTHKPLNKGPDNYPVVGWLHVDHDTVIPLVSYRGDVVQLSAMLKAMRDEIKQTADRLDLDLSGNISYTLVPA